MWVKNDTTANSKSIETRDAGKSKKEQKKDRYEQLVPPILVMFLVDE